MLNTYRNIKSDFGEITKVIIISVLSLFLTMIIVFDEYLQPKFAIRIFLIHAAGLIVIAILLNILLRLKIKSLFWKVEVVIFTYFMLYFFITKTYMFLKYNGNYFRSNGTDLAELMTFFIILFCSIIITLLLGYLSKKQKKLMNSTEIPKELGKNKWLYPADEFVEKWKKAKHYKSITFEL